MAVALVRRLINDQDKAEDQHGTSKDPPGKTHAHAEPRAEEQVREQQPADD